MKLFIVESPNKVAKIQHILGDGWKVAASVGHIRDLPQHEMGVEAPHYQPRYVLSDKSNEIVERLKTLAKNSDGVYLATDPDREGEAIAWHLKETLKLRNYQRVTFGAVTHEAVTEAIKKQRPIDDKLVRAQEARRVLDRLVGYRVSGPLSAAFNTAALSAGRVQSPCVRLIVERERKVQTFKPTIHFGARLNFGTWHANWIVKPHLPPDEEYLLDKNMAEQAAAARQLIVEQAEKSTVNEAPPAPYRSTTLMQACANALGLSLEESAKISQDLFDTGLITYHRVDSQNHDEVGIREIRDYLSAQNLPMHPSVRKWKEKDAAQIGHGAIRPTRIELEEGGTTDLQKAVYRMIRIRSLASQMAVAEYNINVLTLRAVDTKANDGKPFIFEARGRVRIVDGWRAFMGNDLSEDSDKEEAVPANAVPMLDQNVNICAESGKLVESKTRAPARYTPSTIVATMENIGIGRPSTYPSILGVVQKRGYVVLEGKALKPTPLGVQLVLALIKGGFEFIDLNFTRELEEKLDRIAQGELSYVDVIEATDAQLKNELAQLHADFPQKIFNCPLCKSKLKRIWGKTGVFWACENPNKETCNTTLPDKKAEPDYAAGPDLQYRCRKCDQPLVHKLKTGQGGYDFWSCHGFPQCKASYKSKAGKPDLRSAG